jgi:hypothetical protein
MRFLHLPNRRRAQKYVTLEDLALELHTQINLADSVESVKWKLSSLKFCAVQNIHFTISGREIPNQSQLREYLDMSTRFLLSWHSPIA